MTPDRQPDRLLAAVRNSPPGCVTSRYEMRSDFPVITRFHAVRGEPLLQFEPHRIRQGITDRAACITESVHAGDGGDPRVPAPEDADVGHVHRGPSAISGTSWWLAAYVGRAARQPAIAAARDNPAKIRDRQALRCVTISPVGGSELGHHPLLRTGRASRIAGGANPHEPRGIAGRRAPTWVTREFRRAVDRVLRAARWQASRPPRGERDPERR
jgi:hypothetical protein